MTGVAALSATLLGIALCSAAAVHVAVAAVFGLFGL